MPSKQEIKEIILPQGIKPKSKWVVPVDLGAIEYKGLVPFPNCDWEVQLPLIGEYTKPDLTKMDKVVKKFEDWVGKHNIAIPDEKLKGHGGHAQLAVAYSEETFPTYQIEGVEVELRTIYSLALLCFDDAVPVFVKDKSPSEINKGFAKFHNLLKIVVTGGFDAVGDIVKDVNYDESIACFKPVLEIFYYAYKTGEKEVPGFTEEGKLEWFLYAFVDYTQLKKLLLDQKFIAYMDEGPTRWLQYPDNAIRAGVDFAFASINFRPRSEIREHSVYRFVKDLISLTMGTANDIYTLAYDIETKNEFNYVVQRTKWEDITLKEAMKLTLDVLENQVNDVDLTLRCLSDEFEHDAEITKTVEILKDICNGSITCLRNSSRYGQIIAKPPVLRSKSE